MRLDCANQINSLIWEAYVKFPDNNLDGKFNYICRYVFLSLRKFAWYNRSFVINQTSCARHNLESHRMDLNSIAPVSQDDFTLKELYDTLLGCCSDTIDQTIVAMRTQRYLNEEIISTLNLTEYEYFKRLRNIVRKFKDALL